jgi:hypothetical protein
VDVEPLKSERRKYSEVFEQGGEGKTKTMETGMTVGATGQGRCDIQVRKNA